MKAKSVRESLKLSVVSKIIFKKTSTLWARVSVISGESRPMVFVQQFIARLSFLLFQ